MYQIVLKGSLLLEMPEFMTLNGQKKTQKNPHKIWKVIIGKKYGVKFYFYHNSSRISCINGINIKFISYFIGTCEEQNLWK